ncbi:hypothetical protein EXIGLDRAFT_88633 [Exidia glandulosa HHB12029]|uniref:F-box domain-containing protein n=1 Tax=Exidia glandulosa HHB12029 TaxID=1314781 RepID=A0A165NU46_EXIGL|nr:hypothetical protein EXIGLDRAFT_88633 [Exidia glandulosa HHB12029]
MPKNRRRDDDDDDSSVIVIQSPRPAKRRRQADTVPAQRRAPQRELLEVLKTGVFAFFDPTDLLALSYTCKRVRRFLTADESARIWQRARKRLAGPTPPPCPASMSELAWTSLLFTMKCQQCWHATKRDVEFALRMRYCSKCQLQHVKSSQMLRQYRDVSEDVFRLVPYSWTAGKGVKSQYWWEPEIERVYSEIKALDARVASGDRGAAKERKAFVTKRMRYVQEVLNSVNQCVKWQTEFKAAQETAAAERNAELRRRVLDKFHERGYRRADVDALLADDDIRESSCSGRPWKTLFERISNEIDRQHGGAGPGALRSKIEALHEHYRKFLKKHVPGPHDWTTLIPFGDIVNMHPVRKRLRTTRHRDDDLAALAAEVPTLVKQWRRRVEKKLLALLPATAVADDSDEEEGPDPAERLQLATSVFLREGDVSTQTYPRTLLIPHLLDLEHGPLKYATPDGPWTLDGIKHDPLGVGVVRDFCRYARLDVKTATACQLDESSLRLQCKLCRDEWPLVLSWRQAITHLHAKHEGQRGSWGECADSVRRQVAKLEASMETWTCLLCPVGKRKKRTVEDVQRHIKDRWASGLCQPSLLFI